MTHSYYARFMYLQHIRTAATTRMRATHKNFPLRVRACAVSRVRTHAIRTPEYAYAYATNGTIVRVFGCASIMRMYMHASAYVCGVILYLLHSHT